MTCFDVFNGDADGIFAQKYFANATKNGGEFLINETTSANQQMVSLAVRDTENFVAVRDQSAVMCDAFGVQTIGAAGFFHQFDKTLFEHACADTAEDVIFGFAFQDDAVDAPCV